MTQAHSYAAHSSDTPLAPYTFERRELRPDDVAIDILYCGVCHSDLYTVRGEWGQTYYPIVPGHEVVGRVTAVGPEVSKYKQGDLVAVGCLVDSCKDCSACDDGLEQYCEKGFTGTYGGQDKLTGEPTQGGYSDKIVVRESFVLKVNHDEKDLAAVAPLLCAGITTWSPLRHWGVGPGKSVGIVGIGGLGHMGVKLAKALGAHVVAFTTSESKRADAHALGADEVVISRNPDEMKAKTNSLDFILDTVAAPHNLDDYTSLLKRDGSLVLVGAPPEPHPSPSVSNLIFRRKSIAGSLIGGIAETQEVLDFCADKGIVSDIEIIPIQDIEKGYERMLRSDVKYRFVIEMQSLNEQAA